MSDLAINLDDFGEAARNLTTVHREFEGATTVTDSAGDAISHRRLLHQVHEFSANWKKKREEMLGNVGNLGKAADGVVNAFRQVDADLADALKDAASQAPTGPKRGMVEA